MKEKKAIGRPPLYKKPEDLQKKVDEYFISGRNTRKVTVGKGDSLQVIEIPIVTICGLVRYCGFCNRGSFYDYEKNPEFTNTIKNARNRIEEEYEELLQRGLGAGAIFALKNFGWIDTPLVDNSTHNHYVIFRNPQAVKENASDIKPRAEIKNAELPAG